LKDGLIESERTFLRILAFDVEVVHPHHFALHFLRDLKASDDLANLTIAILNDCARMPLCLHYEPQVIACSAL
jgi:cyclin L